MRTPLLRLLAAGAAALLLAQGEAFAGRGAVHVGSAERWKLDFKLSLAQKEGRWVFSITGSTDLPAATILRARIYVINVVNDPFEGPREDDDEALLWADDEGQPVFRRYSPGAGWFHEDVHSFVRKPYSLRYRAKVHYVPKDQTDAITLKVGDAEFFHKADLRVGTDADYENEWRERLGGAAEDFQRIEKIGRELDAWTARAGKQPAAWAAFREATAAALAALLETNRHRYELWAVWHEHQSRMRIKALCGILERILAALDEGADVKRIRNWLQGFEDELDAAYTIIGFNVPLDPAKAGPALAAYEKAVAPLRGGPQPVALGRRARAEALAALFDLLPLIRSRQRAYPYVNTLGVRLNRVVELLQAGSPPAELGEALAAHETALRDFRNFAGLKGP